jgi:tetraacyldisaccharide 4'-kinase
MDLPQIDDPVAAFCGIARPEQFFSGLESSGVRVLVKKTFADHHHYSKRDLEGLIGSARAAGAGTLITTEKDEVRLGGLRSAVPGSLRLCAVALNIAIDDETAAADWLVNKLADRFVRKF